MSSDGINNNDTKLVGSEGSVQNADEVNTTKNGVLQICEKIISDDEKIKYTKNVLSQEKFEIIGEKWILCVDMTIEKLNEIGDNLIVEQIKALGGECLSLKKMTDEKITVIGYMLGKEDIERIGPDILAEISIEELNSIV